MIRSWEDYKAYVKADQSNFVGRGLRGQAFADPICDQYLQRQYLRCLRMAEYAINCHHPLLKLYALWRLRRLGRISGFQIPPNVLGKGVTLFHWGTHHQWRSTDWQERHLPTKRCYRQKQEERRLSTNRRQLLCLCRSKDLWGDNDWTQCADRAQLLCI